MPLDSIGHSQYDDFYRNRFLGVELKFAWLPKTCYLSGKLIWLTKGYRITKIYGGPGDAIFEYRWHDKNTHIMWLLKR
jgi:hypothetical protein